MSAPQQRRPSKADTRRQVAELTSQEWGFGAWSNPVTAALAVYVAGMIVHAVGVGWPAVLLGGLVFTAAFVLATMAKHTRLLGIGYSAALALGVTGWLAWAAAHATFTVHDWTATRDNLIGLGIGALPFAVVYAVLIHDRNEVRAAAKAAEQWLVGERKYWHEACEKAGIRRWYYTDGTATAGGKAVRMQIRPGGTPYGQAVAKLPMLEVALKAAYDGAVRMERGGDATQVVLYVNERNMLAETLPIPAETARRSLANPLSVGLYEDREPAAISYAYRSSLTIAQRDGGKSNFGNVRLLGFQRCDDVLQWVVDFKGGSLARPYLAPYAAGEVESPAFDWVACDIPTLDLMLDVADAIASGRASRRGGDKVRTTHRVPAIRIDIDELADLTADRTKLRVILKLIKLLRKHRSEGIDLDMSSQRVTMSFLSDYARDIASQVGVLTVGRLSDPAEVFNTLNVDRSRIGGIDPSQFEYSGTLLTIADGMRKMPYKAWRVDDDPDDPTLIPDFVRACAPYRPTLEPEARADAGGVYARRWHTDAARALLVSAARSIGADFKPAHLADAAEAEVIPIHRTTPQHTDEAPQPSTRPVALAPNAFRDALVRQFGHEDGTRRWLRAEGAAALRAMRTILTDAHQPALPTRDLLSHLASTDTTRWGDLSPAKLAQLLADYPISSTQLGTGQGPWDGNPRGYRLADITTAIDTGPSGHAAGTTA